MEMLKQIEFVAVKITHWHRFVAPRFIFTIERFVTLKHSDDLIQRRLTTPKAGVSIEKKILRHFFVSKDF